MLSELLSYAYIAGASSLLIRAAWVLLPEMVRERRDHLLAEDQHGAQRGTNHGGDKKPD
jgi:hypothetical protein